jgi:formylglycine-generating enzyme required for sulfatase activity
MGCSPGDEGYCSWDEKPPHSVTVSAFEMLETEVTEAQYLAVTGDDPSCDYGEGGGPNSPVECTNWFDSNAFCEAVGARLPTEAEWEFAARGGTKTRFYCGDSCSCLDGIAWYVVNSGDHKHDVKGKAPNAYGLYDMLGNVWEWNADWFSEDYYSVSPTINPKGPIGGSERVLRGGCFYFGCLDTLRVSDRFATGTLDHGGFLGFRCARDVEP